MKINRLLETTILLINRGSVTAKELADRFGVSMRTIYRDIDVLSVTGVPVYTSKGSKGGIHLMENYALNKAIVNEDEIDSLLLALKTLQATKLPDVEGILDKMGAVFRNANKDDWVHIEFSPWGSGPNEDNKFLNIKLAILKRKVITFEYINSQGNKSSRCVEPMQLVFKGQAWYLWGYCITRNEYRTFRISRIKKLAITDRVFSKRDSANYHDNTPSTVPRVIDVTLRFKAGKLYRVYDDYDEEFITMSGDGSCEVHFSVPPDEWLYSYILSFGSDVEVVEPVQLRQIIYDRLESALKYYR